MSEVAADSLNLSRPEHDAAVAAYAEVLRGAIERIPANQRDAVLAKIQDLLAKPKAPQRGGELLNNVFELFKKEPTVERRASDVIRELNLDAEADAKPVHNALNYLYGTKVLHRIGYGLYRLENGSVVEGSP